MPPRAAAPRTRLCSGPGRRAQECSCTQWLSRAHPGAPRSSGTRSLPPVPGCPAYPTPARIWRRTRHRRALPVSGSAVTRATLAPPRATSPAPSTATLLRPNKEAPGRRGACHARTGRARPKGQGRRRRSQSGFCATHPTRCGSRNYARPPRKPGRAAPVAPGSGGTQKPVPPAVNRHPAAPRGPASASAQPAAIGWPQGRNQPAPTRDPPELQPGATWRRRRAPNKGDSRDRRAGRGFPTREATMRRLLTGICLLIEDCGLIIQPVPRRRRHRRWWRLQGRRRRWSWRSGGGGDAGGGGGTRLYHAVSGSEQSA
ncbi:translation initiation factor IF-2-like [Trachypithecus francoisi]|uniref:translation initiation factor IF-2-like n=1 Tax=Trachypithecus francoisi TaxID=54180 RepID=UPI00141A6E78|nr:translation initiation factor IF-2-like [Trachypithecus francoisi]